MQKKIYNLILNEKGRFSVKPNGPILLSHKESGGVRFLFSLPAEWEGYDSVTLEHMKKGDKTTRISSAPLSREGGKYVYDIDSEFTRNTGRMLLQLVGKSKSGERRKTIAEHSPDITVKGSINAVKTVAGESGTPAEVIDDGILDGLLARIDALQAALAGKSDKSDTYTKAETDGLVASAGGGAAGQCDCGPFNPSEITARLEALENSGGSIGGIDLSAILAALEQKADKSDVPEDYFRFRCVYQGSHFQSDLAEMYAAPNMWHLKTYFVVIHSDSTLANVNVSTYGQATRALYKMGYIILSHKYDDKHNESRTLISMGGTASSAASTSWIDKFSTLDTNVPNLNIQAANGKFTLYELL